MNFRDFTGKTIDEAFADFDRLNPEVYEHYKKFAFAWLATGAAKISSKQIIGRIRWFVEVETVSADHNDSKDFKINDAFTSRYARKFIHEFPIYKQRFELRELRSQAADSADTDTDIPNVTFDTTFKLTAA